MLNEQYYIEWEAKREEFFNRLHVMCEEMYLEEPHIFQESLEMMATFVAGLNRQSDIDDEVEEFKRQIEGMDK